MGPLRDSRRLLRAREADIRARRARVGARASAVDSLAERTYDDLFAEMHLDLIKDIAARERAGTLDAPLLEAHSLVSASEELYLSGMTEAALKLLDEASRTLKQKR